jgi:hypothetical protein
MSGGASIWNDFSPAWLHSDQLFALVSHGNSPRRIHSWRAASWVGAFSYRQATDARPIAVPAIDCARYAVHFEVVVPRILARLKQPSECLRLGIDRLKMVALAQITGPASQGQVSRVVGPAVPRWDHVFDLEGGN